ncbi:DUF5994 family protein [Streptomyces sp. NBC_01235]|uniref:DUF5994 family protein n=1 Tax=Streptomyces sp. NBC_01235 TaxID=2903788 RepID=UPI002E10F1EF|nr:DUF5994 family protein [Streptomyces sp. NBC_01235]
MTTALQPPPPPSHPLLRLTLAPHGTMPRPIDGAWWPRSYDLLAELPHLLSGLPAAWGQITRVTVNGAKWSAVPGRILVCNQVVRLSRTLTSSAPHTIVLLAPGRGRWDLVVVPPDTTEQAAKPLMAAAGHA